jgi:hypothetical protein
MIGVYGKTTKTSHLRQVIAQVVYSRFYTCKSGNWTLEKFSDVLKNDDLRMDVLTRIKANSEKHTGLPESFAKWKKCDCRNHKKGAPCWYKEDVP